jgi:hypothetical protein
MNSLSFLDYGCDYGKESSANPALRGKDKRITANQADLRGFNDTTAKQDISHRGTETQRNKESMKHGRE